MFIFKKKKLTQAEHIARRARMPRRLKEEARPIKLRKKMG